MAHEHTSQAYKVETGQVSCLLVYLATSVDLLYFKMMFWVKEMQTRIRNSNKCEPSCYQECNPHQGFGRSLDVRSALRPPLNMFGLCSRCVVGAFYKVVAFYMCIFLTFLSKLGGAYYILKRFIVRKVR